jgi:hypothetical protein
MNRPGYKSSEFWLAVVATMGTLFLSSGLVGETHWVVKAVSLLVAALASMGYSASRGAVKSAALTPQDPATLTAPPKV